VDPRAGIDELQKRKSLYSTGIRNPDRPALSLLAIPTELVQRYRSDLELDRILKMVVMRCFKEFRHFSRRHYC
jgi:hypothetical protein